MKISDTKGDQWDDMAKEYKSLSGDVTARITSMMLERVNSYLSFSSATGILDNGCGPGSVITRLIEAYGEAIPAGCDLMASDFSGGMIEQVNKTKAENVQRGSKVWERVHTEVLNAMDLATVPDDSKTHVTAGLVYFMTPDPQRCLAESLRVLKKDGVLACSSWEGSDWLEVMNQLEVACPDLKMPRMPPTWSEASAVKAQLEQAGFRDIEVERVPVTMDVESCEKTTEFMLTKMPHMVALTKGLGEKDLDDIRQAMLKKCKEVCPVTPGKIHGFALLALGRK